MAVDRAPRGAPRWRGPRFFLVDVFAREPLAGNPLAVVADAEDLGEDLMRRIAREFNQSETTFVLPPSRTGADWRLRSFTPSGQEVFGAGHNALGAWWWLAEDGRLPLDGPRASFAQEIGDLVLPVEVTSEAGLPVAVTMSQAPPDFGAVQDDAPALASALRLPEGNLGAGGLRSRVVSTGAAHLLVPARDRGAVERARPDAELLAALLRDVGGQGCYLFCLDPVDPSAMAYARFFNPTVGIREDPATGSAAGPLACYLAANGLVEGEAVRVEQGHAIGRPSEIEVRVSGDDVRISGGAVVVAEGILRLRDAP
jgi:trans-2,3-dihydro-3-hydroxyanthranilate isomerase